MTVECGGVDTGQNVGRAFPPCAKPKLKDMKTYIVKQIKRNGLVVKETEFLMCNDACDFALNEAMEHLHCVFDLYARSEQGDVFLQRV